MKKRACLSILAISLTATAYQNNFYVGGDAGIFQADFNNTYLDETSAVPKNFQQPVTQQGYTGGVLMGYSRVFQQRYFLGEEISANVDSNLATFQEGGSTAPFSDKTSINEHMDFSFVPGINITSSIATFLKLGISIAWIQDELTSFAGSTVTNYCSNNTTAGFIAALGVSKMVSTHLKLFTEADYHDYGTVNFPAFQNSTLSYAHSTALYSYDVLAGAAYQFEF